MRPLFKRELEESNFIHKPLPIHYQETREARCEKKTPIQSVLLDDMSSLESWEAKTEYARIELSDTHTRGTNQSLKLTTLTKLDHWPRAFGRIYAVPGAVRRVNKEDWRAYNRISFWVYADMPGFRSISFRMQFLNGGKHPVPDRYDREGHHNMNLIHGEWFRCQVEIPYLHRDEVLGLSFEYDMVGHENSACEKTCFYIADIRLETLAEEDLDIYEGWQPGRGRIAFSGSGYQMGSLKTAVVNEPQAKEFKLVETATGKVVLKKKIGIKTTVNGTFQVLDFSEVIAPGEYIIVCGDIVSRSFPIGNDVWEDSIWKTLNFLFCERCGTEVPGKHGPCHADAYVSHEGKRIVTNGGWHDAGDMTQTTTNTSECTYALFELLTKLEKGSLLYERVLEEAKWGLEWVLKTRFGDGFRVPSSSKSCWTNGILDDYDDIYREAALEPIENFMCAGAQAIAGKVLMESDSVLAAYAIKCAREDWQFAFDNQDKNGREPLDDPNRVWSPLLMYSAGCWSAIDLYDVTGEDYYREQAIAFAGKIMACQQQELTDWDIPYVGFFYDDTDKKLIEHVSHRSHQSEPLQALFRLTERFAREPEYKDWLYALHLYGDYIKNAYESTAPYYAAPASIYHEDEACRQDEYDMGMIKRWLAEDERKENYKKQVQNGVPLGKGYYLRRFPVAFEHRGNHCMTLCGGKAASMAAQAAGDYILSEMAQRQLEWIVGKNPFAESVMFGEGYDYCQEYAVLPGEMVGELGVGFSCLDEHDSPFWPQVNTCVYKEVWIRPPLLWIWLMADTHGGAKVSGITPNGAGRKPVLGAARGEGAACSGNDEVVFRRLSGGIFAVKTCEETGWFETELPAGEYIIEHGGRVKKMTLLPSCRYRILFPLENVEVKTEKFGRMVNFTIHTSAACDMDIQNVNLEMEKLMRVPAGETMITAHIIDQLKPFLAVFTPDNNAADKVCAYGR